MWVVEIMKTSGGVRKPVITALDAGGTLTDTVIVDAEGNFTAGKALTTPKDESVGFANSVADAASYWKMSLSDVLQQVLTTVYSGTIMINALHTRSGLKVGLITTKGFEDCVLMERGLVWLGYSYPDRLHTVTHVHNEPLVPKKRVKGVTERIDMMGEVVIPLYKQEVEKAVEELLDFGVEAIAVLFLYSYINPEHEKKAAEIAKNVMKKRGVNIPVVLSSEVAPIMREYSRLNSVLMQAYAAEPTREQLFKIEKKAKKNGYQRNLLTILSYGGLVDIRYPRLYETLISGPIGGMLGARYVGELLGIKDIISTDMGGTSFDVGIIRGGVIPMLREPDIARFRVNLPMVMMDSIGAGTGTVIKVDPVTRRIDLGPESAGAAVGMCYEYPEPTISDCNVTLGYLNPDYFLGGRVKLDKDRAYKACKKVAEVMERDVYEIASGIIGLLNSKMRNHIDAMLLARGYSPVDYTIMAYGGAGPLHMWGFTEGIPFKNIMTFPFAAVFSAFGIATADYMHRYHKGILGEITSGTDEITMMMKTFTQARINSAWEELEQRALTEFEAEGIPKDKTKLVHLAYVRYKGQLDDHEVVSPVHPVSSLEDLDKITKAFEETYERIYPKAARFPEAGYQILEVGIVASAETMKPKVPKRPISSAKPPKNAFKGEREVYHQGKWITFSLWEMDLLEAGNEIASPSIIEHPTTTLVVPPGNKVWFDEYKFIWYGKS